MGIKLSPLNLSHSNNRFLGWHAIATSITLSILLLSTFTALASVRNEEGNYKDWDFSPRGVYGIVPVENVKGKEYYNLKKNGPDEVVIKEINHHGDVVTSATIKLVNGKPASTVHHDRWGAVTFVSTIKVTSENEVLVTSREDGKNTCLPCYGYKLIYDGDLIVEKRWVDANGKPCTDKNSKSVLKIKKNADGNLWGMAAERAYYDENEKPAIINSSNYHKITYAYDAHGNETRVQYFDTEGKPIKNNNGVYGIRSQYDADDNITIKEYPGPDGKMTNSNYGVAKVVYEYDKALLKKSTNYNEDNRIIEYNSKEDIGPIGEHTYDGQGNEIDYRRYDEYGGHVGKIHQQTSKYNSKNQKTEEMYFGTKGESILDTRGVHHYKFGYDKTGRRTSIEFFDNRDNASKDNIDDVHMVKYQFDDENRVTSVSFWQNANTKTNRWNGYAEETHTYDSVGNVVETTTLDEKGQPKETKTGYSRRHWEYNQQGQEASVSFFSGKEPATVNQGYISKYHSIHYTYKNNKIISLQYHDTDGKPTNAVFAFQPMVSAYRIDFTYLGSQLISENLFALDQEKPVKDIDCKLEDSVVINGIGIRTR